MTKPMISIICNTYNQERFIKDAIDSFLMQKLNVPFEILIHDDASTDGTADIIRTYEAQYPDIIKPIYQKVNQYSKGISITGAIQIPRALGKYIAFCEGDDYWTDPQKLQIQYDFMEHHPEYSGCCHAYNMICVDGSLIKECRDFQQNMPIPMKRLIGNQLEIPQFATLFVNRSCANDFNDGFLGLRRDIAFRLCCAAKGDIFYINRNMSCYRRFVDGSWTVQNQSKDVFISHLEEIIPFLNRYNEYTGYRYDSDIAKCIDRREFDILLLKSDYRNAIRKKAFWRASIKRKIGVLLGCVCPVLVKRIQ